MQNLVAISDRASRYRAARPGASSAGVHKGTELREEMGRGRPDLSFLGLVSVDKEDGRAGHRHHGEEGDEAAAMTGRTLRHGQRGRANTGLAEHPRSHGDRVCSGGFRAAVGPVQKLGIRAFAVRRPSNHFPIQR